MNIKRFLFFPFLLVCHTLFALNDGPCEAQELGTLPAPLFCPSNAFGDSIQVSGSTLSATSEPLSYALQACAGGGNISNLTPDVWFRFTATGNQIVIRVQGTGSQQMIQPGISLFFANGGKCLNLIPMNCEIGSGGIVIMNYNGLVPGLSYYIQIRGCATINDKGDFTLSLKNASDCNDCTQDTYLNTIPFPVNGFYPPGASVTFVYAIRGFKSIQGNFMKAVKLNVTQAWDTTGIAASVSPASPSSGHGTWKWDKNYSGFIYDENSNGVFSDDLGDTSTIASIWVFTFTLKTKNCPSTFFNLDLDLRNISVGEFYSTNFACQPDPAQRFKAVLNCCNVSLPVPAATSCMSTCDGAITVYGSSTNLGSYPLNVKVYDAYGTFTGVGGLITTIGGNISGNIFCRKDYNTFVKDTTTGCIDARNVFVPGPVSYLMLQTGISCEPVCNNTAQIFLFNNPSGYTYSWSGQQGNTASGLNPTNLCSGLHEVTLSVAGCPDYIDSIMIFSIPGGGSTVVYPPQICYQPGTAISPYVSNPGGIFFGPGLTINNQDGTIYMGTTSGLPGNYSMIYTSPAPCFQTDTFPIAIVQSYDASFVYPGTKNYCKTTTDTVSPFIANQLGIFTWSPLNATSTNLVIDSINGQINVDASVAGTYLVMHTINDTTPCIGFHSDTLIISDTCNSAPVSVPYNGISPNNDGFNDSWIIPGIENRTNRVTIFNRYGNKIYDVTDYNNTTIVWDGKGSDGKSLPPGTYFYIVHFTDTDEIQKAWIEILK